MSGEKVVKKAGILALFFLFLFFLNVNFSYATEEDVFQEAKRFYQQGDYEKAIKLLDDFITKSKAKKRLGKNKKKFNQLLQLIIVNVFLILNKNFKKKI